MEVDIPMKAWQQLAAMAPPLAVGIFSESTYQARVHCFMSVLGRIYVRWQPLDQGFLEAHTLLVQYQMAE